jgi:predicted GIY-YIG superfamily endonuclease
MGTSGRPAYIGITNDVIARTAQHDAAAREFLEGDVLRTVKWYPSRKAALEAEARAIREEQPIFNVQHNAANPHRRRTERRRKKETVDA